MGYSIYKWVRYIQYIYIYTLVGGLEHGFYWNIHGILGTYGGISMEYPWNIRTGAFYVGNGWEWGNGVIIDSYFFLRCK